MSFNKLKPVLVYIYCGDVRLPAEASVSLYYIFFPLNRVSALPMKTGHLALCITVQGSCWTLTSIGVRMLMKLIRPMREPGEEDLIYKLTELNCKKNRQRISTLVTSKIKSCF